MYALAQVNVGRLRAPLDNPLMADYMAHRPLIDQLARTSPGFLWRGTAQEANLYEDPMIIANMSLWATLDDYMRFVYQSGHQEMLERGSEWFQPIEGPNHALWWMPRGQIPSAKEARGRLEHVKSHGATPYAFTYQNAFPAPDDSVL